MRRPDGPHDVERPPGGQVPPPTGSPITTGGSALPDIAGRMADLNADVIHLYGLTETFGPTVLCEWGPEWDRLPADGPAQAEGYARALST